MCTVSVDGNKNSNATNFVEFLPSSFSHLFSICWVLLGEGDEARHHSLQQVFVQLLGASSENCSTQRLEGVTAHGKQLDHIMAIIMSEILLTLNKLYIYTHKRVALM